MGVNLLGKYKGSGRLPVFRYRHWTALAAGLAGIRSNDGDAALNA